MPTFMPTFTCECYNPDDTPVERKLYNVTGDDGSVSVWAYCADCAGLAMINWTGETPTVTLIDAST